MPKIGLFSNDAGGAEILSSWAIKENSEFLIKVHGPAKDIFKRKFESNLFTNKSVKETVSECDSIICSTSWDSDLEKNAMKEAIKSNKKSVAILDHWVNYKERFEDKFGNLINPTEIWVCDRYAQEIAKNIFFNSNIKLIKNPYFESIKLQISKNTYNQNKTKNIKKILYVCEPIKDHANKMRNNNFFGYTEEEAINYFLTNIKNIFNCKTEIIIRPHPSEDPDKYNWVLDDFDLDIVISKDENLVNQICYADVVIGCESMALVVGVLAEKQVISSIPNGGKKCELPHKEIQSLQYLLKEKNV